MTTGFTTDTGLTNLDLETCLSLAADYAKNGYLAHARMYAQIVVTVAGPEYDECERDELVADIELEIGSAEHVNDHDYVSDLRLVRAKLLANR